MRRGRPGICRFARKVRKTRQGVRAWKGKNQKSRKQQNSRTKKRILTIKCLDDASKLLGGKRKSESDRDPNPTTVEGNPKDRNEECTLPEGKVTENPIVVTAADRNRSV